MKTSQYLFTYGTLRHDAPASKYGHFLAANTRMVGIGHVSGRLHLIDWYPAAVEAPNEDELIKGIVYHMERPDIVLPLLDAYEDCDMNAPQQREYRREVMQVHMESGDYLEAWVYLYNRPVHAFPHIVHGDFVTWVRDRRIKSGQRWPAWR